MPLHRLPWPSFRSPLALTATLVLASGTARAQPSAQSSAPLTAPAPGSGPGAGRESAKEAARALMDEADRLVEERRLEDALARYERAHALMRVPTTGLEVARTLAAMGKLASAIEAAIALQRLPRPEPEPKAFAAARKDADDLAARLTLRVPTVQIDLARELDVNRVRVEIDDQPVPPELVLAPRPVNPGRHLVRVSSPGRVAKTFTLDLKEGARTRLLVVLEEGDGAGLPTLAIVGIAAMGVGLVVGSITGIVSLGKASDARTACGPDTGNCAPAAESAIRSAKTTGWISTVSFALALGGGGLAAHALLTRGSTTLAAGPQSAGASVGGAF